MVLKGCGTSKMMGHIKLKSRRQSMKQRKLWRVTVTKGRNREMMMDHIKHSPRRQSVNNRKWWRAIFLKGLCI